MKILILVSTLNSLKGGGVSEVVYYLSKFFKSKKHIDYKICSLKTEELPKEVESRWEQIDTVVFKKSLNNSYSYSKSLKDYLFNTNYDLIHTHGIWQYFSLLALNVFRKRKIKYIVSPHGMLDKWALKNSRWKKQLLLNLYERKFLQNAACIHALNQEEANSIRVLGIKTPICIIPNGIELPIEKEKLVPILEKKDIKEKKVLLFLGRLHPKKGLENLIDAWEILKSKKISDDWTLIIAGWSNDNYDQMLKDKVNKKQLQNLIKFTGSVTGKEKNSILENADAFILPSFSEGLPMSILEAMSYKLPVLMTRECNLSNAFEKNAAIEIETNVESISKNIEKFICMKNNEKNELANNGFEFVKNNYTWNKVVDQFEEVYNWIINNKNKPNTIV